MKFFRGVVDVLRGAAIGVAETIPGVSGGTVALIVGVYQTLIGSIASVVRSVLSLGTPSAARRHWRSLPWGRLIPLAAGMVTAIVVAARFIEPLLTDYPELTRAAFFGMILASIAIPLAMAGLPMRPGETLLIVLVAGGVFTALGLPAGSVTEPAWWAVMLSAAVAVCALVLPGVSGSFLLLTLGLYDDTIAAVNNRNLEYLGLFFLGALVGVSSFVLLLQWLLDHARRLTLIVMTGLLLGSLRALWPWQSESRELLAAVPGEIGAAVGVGLAGAAVVLALMGLERLIRRG